MKRLHRLDLSPQTISFLDQRTRRVAAAADPRAEAMRLWNLRRNAAFREIREVLDRMASGIERCMYCEDGPGTDIEHFWPKADYPERAFDWLNYLLACSRCNSNHKRNQFPRDAGGDPLLVNPTEEDPLDHLRFTPTGLYEPLSAKGSFSIQIFGLNRAMLAKGRRNAWITLQALLISYARYRELADNEMADRLKASVKESTFAGVFAGLLRIAAGPDAEVFVHRECLQVLRDSPDIAGWV